MWGCKYDMKSTRLNNGNGWKDFGYRMFILLMVFGIIGGGIFSLHGHIFGYVLFSIGLICIPLYIHSLKTTHHSEGSP